MPRPPLEARIIVRHRDSELAKLEAIHFPVLIKRKRLPRRCFATPPNDGLESSWNNIKDEN